MGVIFAAALGFLAWDRLRPVPPPPAPPPAPLVLPASPVFSDEDLAMVRGSLLDGDPEVRWAAIQLLFNIRDPQLGPALEKMLSQDPDEGIRLKIIGMLKGREEVARLGALVRGLSDPEKAVRLASLDALGDIGDPSVVVWVTAVLRDTEPEVRMRALRTLGRFQDKRKAEFSALAEKLRLDYHAALRRAAQKR